MLDPTSIVALVLLQSSNDGSPVLLLVIVLAIAGAVADWKYHKAGGKPSSRRDRIFFWSLALLIVAAIALTEFAGWDPNGILAFTVIPLTAWLSLAWEIGRWRMRRKYPLPNRVTGTLESSSRSEERTAEQDERRIRAEVARRKQRATDLGIAKSAWELNHDLPRYSAWAVNCPEIVHPNIKVLGVAETAGEWGERGKRVEAKIRENVYAFTFRERDIESFGGEPCKSGNLDVEIQGHRVMTVDCHYSYDQYAGETWTPGDVSAFLEGPWVFELNSVYSEVSEMHRALAVRNRDAARQEELRRLKRDFGI